MDYNLAVEKANNEMLLLNVLRAKDRKPMYITSISALRGKLSTDINTGDVGAAFGPGVLDGKKYSIAPSATFSTSPEFDVGVLDSEKFYRGFLTPISPDLLAYFFDLRMRGDLLLQLLVSRIDVKNKEGVTETFAAKPSMDNEELGVFLAVARQMFSCNREDEFCKPDLNKADSPVKVGPEFALGDVGTLDGVVAAIQAGFSFEKSETYPRMYVLLPPSSASSVTMPKTRITGACEDIASVEEGSKKQDCEKAVERVIEICAEKRADFAFVSNARGGKAYRKFGEPKNGGCSVSLRSPEGMLHFLGELAREQITSNSQEEGAGAYVTSAGGAGRKSGKVSTFRNSSVRIVSKEAGESGKLKLKVELQPLFSVTTGAGVNERDSFVSVTYDGATYLIPRSVRWQDEFGSATQKGKDPSQTRAMQALSLVQLVLGLQKSVDDLPKTGTVSVLGGIR